MADDEARLNVRCGSYSTGLASSLLEDLRSDSPKSAEHFVTFECENGTRYIHKIVLRLNNLDFDDASRKISVLTEAFDRVIEFIYDNKTTLIGYHEIMGAYEVAKLLHCDDLVREIERGLECSLRKFLALTKFVEMCSNDNYKSLGKTIRNLRLDTETKTILLHRFAASSPEGSLQRTLLDCKTPRRIYYYRRDLKPYCVVDAMDLEPVASEVEIPLYSDAVIFEDKMFLGTKMNFRVKEWPLRIMSFHSGKLLQEFPNFYSDGVTIHNGEPYVWTKKQMFLLSFDASSNQYTPELILSDGYFCNVRILRRSGKQVVFARQNKSAVEIVNARKDREVYSYTIIKREPDCQLIGNVGDAVWVCFADSGWYTNLQTCETFLFKQENVKSRRVLNGYLFSLTRVGCQDLIWRTDLETRRSICSGFVESSREGSLSEHF